jgi:hypothetical protein
VKLISTVQFITTVEPGIRSETEGCLVEEKLSKSATACRSNCLLFSVQEEEKEMRREGIRRMRKSRMRRTRRKRRTRRMKRMKRMKRRRIERRMKRVMKRRMKRNRMRRRKRRMRRRNRKRRRRYFKLTT